MKKSIFLIVLGIILFKSVFAQEIVFTATAPSYVNMGEIFTVTYTLDKDIDKISVKFSENFNYISGAHTSFSKQMSINNGKIIDNIKKTFDYELKPVAKGQFIIPKASIIVDGKKYYSNTLTINVIGASDIQQPDSIEGMTKDELYTNFSFSKQEVFVQEGFIATLKLYSTQQVSEISEFELSAFDDFLCYDLADSVVCLKTDTIDGKKINTAVLKRVLLYPLKSGRLQFCGGKLKCNVMLAVKKEKGKSLFDDFFTSPYKTIERSLEIDTQTIMVKPMPAKMPTDFIHVCGTQLTLNAKVNKTTVKVNTPLVYEITLSGKGNLKLASVPTVNLPAEFDVVRNKANNNIKTSIEGITGSRTFSYTIIPKQEGDFKIPEYSVSYFDLDTKQYKTVYTQPVLINVEKSDSAPSTIKDNKSVLKESSKHIGGCNLVIVLDISATMLAQDLKPNRLNACVNATKTFINKQKGNVGLVVFSEGSWVKCPLMSNRKVISDSLSKISDLDLGLGTAIGLGLSNAILELKNSNAASKAIVLVTDGANNAGSITPKMVAKLAKSYGIRIYAIGVAGKDSLALYPAKTPVGTEMVKVPVTIDEKMLREIANNTNGKYFRAVDNNSFNNIYKEIAKIVTVKSKDNQTDSAMPEVDAEQIINVIAQDIEEFNDKLIKK